MEQSPSLEDPFDPPISPISEEAGAEQRGKENTQREGELPLSNPVAMEPDEGESDSDSELESRADERPRWRLQNRLVPSLFAAAKSMGDVVLKPMDDDPSQLWIREEKAPGRFLMENAAYPDRVLASAGCNLPVKLKNLTSSPDKSCIWCFGGLENEGFRTLQPTSDSTQCLDALDGKVIHGVPLAAHEKKKRHNQLWKLRPWLERYTIRPKCAPKLALTANPQDPLASVSLQTVNEARWEQQWDAKVAKDGGVTFVNVRTGLILCTSTSLGGQVCCSHMADLEERGKWTLGKDEGGCFVAVRPFAVDSQNMECAGGKASEASSVSTGPWIGDGGPHMMWGFFPLGSKEPTHLLASPPPKETALTKLVGALDISDKLPTGFLRRSSQKKDS